jgi:hypothetical protein
MPGETGRSDETDRPGIDSFTIADFAEAIAGKLYVMGGGINVIWGQGFPNTVRVSLAAILRVPWGDTNRRFPVRAWLETADTGEELSEGRLEGQMEAGRPPGGRGEDVIISFAAPVNFTVGEPGRFRLVFEFADDRRVLAFQVVRAAPPAQMQLPPA